MAGWYFQEGCEFFFERIWQDANVADALKARLSAVGAWDIAQRLAG
jgi:hypothetical protein